MVFDLPFLLNSIRLVPSLEHPEPECHLDFGCRNAKSPAFLRRPGFRDLA
jgi:hypothetical protein